MKKKTFIAAACLLLAVAAKALGAELEPNLKFGKPTEAELSMTTYAADSDAVAVVLCELTDVRYVMNTDNFAVLYNVKRRIKVLKDDGKEYANVSIPYYSRLSDKGDKEAVNGLKATAYNVVDGKVVKTRMKSEQEFTEKLGNDRVVKKFTVPQVKVGTVFEYEYELMSENYTNIRDWYAQCALPTLYTSYKVSIPEWFIFSVEESGMQRLESKREPFNQTFLLKGNLLACNGTTHTFIGRNLPAIRDDNFVWHSSDYASHVTAELSGVRIPGVVFKNFSFAWDDVAKTLLDDDDFGGRLKQRNPLEAEMKQQGLMQADDKDRQIADIYRLLKQRVRWNKEYKLWGSPASKVLKDGTGSNADINFMLISMLRSAGIKAFPVVLRSRSRGLLPLTYASVKYLSTFVVAAENSDSTLVMLDGSADDGLNVLPSQLLVERAYAIDQTIGNRWLNLQTISRGRDATFITATLQADGTIEGTVGRRCENVSAAAVRQRFHAATDSTKYVEELAQKRGVAIADYQLSEGLFSPQLTEEYRFTTTVDATADHIYFNPLVFNPWKEPPFKPQSRLLPVEFPYVETESITAQVALPEGYVVEEKPKNLVAQLGKDGSYCRIRYLVADGKATVTYQLVLNSMFFPPEEYAELKAFFDHVAQSTGALMVLKKQ